MRPLVRIPGLRSGIAIGLLLASSALAAPSVREAQFVGDRNADLADPANAGVNADFRRWGTTAAGVDGPQTFLKEKKAGKLTVRNATPTEIRNSAGWSRAKDSLGRLDYWSDQKSPRQECSDTPREVLRSKPEPTRNPPARGEELLRERQRQMP